MSSSESRDENLQYTYHTNSETSIPKAPGGSNTRDTSFDAPGVADVTLGKELVRRPILYKRSETNIPNICVDSSSQNFKHHLKKLHIAVNKILENDRLTKYRNQSKKNFRGNQEACEKMLDAVRELGSFIVQRQNTSPISHHIRPTKDMQSRFPMRVRSKSTTHDDSISHKRNLTVRVGHSLKSVRRPTSLTKRSKSPIKRSVSPYPVIDTENSCCSKHSGHSKGVDIFSQRETKYRFPVKNDTFIASKQETENVQASEDFTNPEIACLEAELSHRDTLIKYLSEQLFKLYQDNDRIFAEYELQEANLTKYLHSLRSRLTETNSNLNQQYTTHNNTTNNTNSIHTDYITHITQSISQDIHINITDSILHHFAKEINDKIINPGINNNNNNDNDVIVTMNPVQRIEQSFISELQDLNLATQNLLNYWEIKNHQMNYPIVCQQFFNALLNFCIISMNSYQLNNQFIDPNIKDLQMKADHAEQQIIDLSNEIKQYQYQLNQLNEKLQKNQLEETNHHLLISDYFLSSTNSSSNNNNIITYLSDTDQTQCILSSPSSSSLLLLDPGSSSQTYESIPKIKSIDDQTIFPLKSTIMPIDISTTTTTTTTTTTIPVDNSINNLLQRLWGMLSKESKLFSTDVHKSKLWISNKEDYDTLYEAYNIIEQFQWYIQNNKLSSFKSSSLVESQSSLSTTATYFAPELVANEINRTTATDKSIPVEVSSITSLTDQSTITALTSNQHKIKDIEEVNLESFKMKELSSCTNYATKSIYLTDMCTSTSDLLTLFINQDQNHQLNIQQVKQMNDQIISTDDLIQTSSLEKEALRELQRKFNYLKDSYNHLVSQYHTFNQTLCKQLKYVNLTFDEYKSNISVYISHKYKNVCDSSIQTDSFNHLPRLTDPSYRQIPLDYRNLYEVEYCHSLWPTNEVISNETIIYNQSMLNTELTTDNCSFELSQLKQDYEILQSKLQKSEREVEILHNNLLDIENHIKLAISNNHFTSLQCILDNGGLSNVQSLTKAFLNQVNTIISNLNQYIPDQDNQIEYESPDHYLTDDKSFPIHSAKRLLVNTEEYDQKYPLYSAEQSLIHLTELQEILQQQIIRKQDTFVEQIEQDNYSFNQEIDRLLDDKPEITELNLTEKLQSALHVIYEELSLCQHLVDKLLSEKTKHCKLIAMQASQIEDLNKELRDYDYKLKAISTGHNIVPHNSDETYENKCYERNDEKVKSECYIYHHNQYPNSLIDSSTNPNKNIINELKLTNQTEIEQQTIMSKEEKEYLTIAKIEETKSTLDKDTLTTSEFTVEMTREKLVSSSLCEDESNVVGQLREELTSCYEQIVKLSRSVEESDASLMDVRRLLTVKESEVADLREEKRHLRDEVNELRETVEAERRDLDMMRANMDVLESKEEVSAMCVECREPNVAAAAAAAAAVEEECVQTEIDDEVFDLVSTLQLELSMKQTEVQEPESRMMVNETTCWIPCETVRKAPDVVVRELAEVDDTDRVEADVFAGVPDMQLVETVASDSVSGIVPDRIDRQSTDLCVEGVSNEEVVLPIHATQSWTKPPSEQDNDDPELALLNTDSLRTRLKEAMSRICELENAKTELSVRLRELEGVMMCEDKPMDVMPLSSRVPDRSMKVTDEADALSKHNKELMTEVDLLRSKISERVTLLDDVCMEMDEVRGSLGFLLKQVRELRAAHAEANADRAEMANRMSEYERVSHRLCETVGRSTSPVQDIDYAHEGSSTDRCTSDGLREDLQRALDTQSFELEAVTEKLKECESMNNALICESDSSKKRLSFNLPPPVRHFNSRLEVNSMLVETSGNLSNFRESDRNYSSGTLVSELQGTCESDLNSGQFLVASDSEVGNKLNDNVAHGNKSYISSIVLDASCFKMLSPSDVDPMMVDSNANESKFTFATYSSSKMDKSLQQNRIDASESHACHCEEVTIVSYDDFSQDKISHIWRMPPDIKDEKMFISSLILPPPRQPCSMTYAESASDIPVMSRSLSSKELETVEPYSIKSERLVKDCVNNTDKHMEWSSNTKAYSVTGYSEETSITINEETRNHLEKFEGENLKSKKEDEIIIKRNQNDIIIECDQKLENEFSQQQYQPTDASKRDKA
ncbi:unnamed protein product, partial [Schistosoma haematobium]